jgi:predicted transcriptional regulator
MLANIIWANSQGLFEHAEKAGLVKVPWHEHGGTVTITEKGRLFLYHVTQAQRLLTLPGEEPQV